jgi:putative (di)nucleoside polyphosphate hydrolase
MRSTGQHFRAGVGVIVINREGKCLSMRRKGSDSWQLPQGGLDPGEEPEDAMWRELQEETGLTRSRCTLIDATRGWLVYELPPAYRRSTGSRGQVQRWYLCRLLGPDAGPDAGVVPDDHEFDDWRWETLAQLTAHVVEFRRPLYRSLAAEFAANLAT